MSESFISYRSFHEALKDLPPEQYGKIMYAINEYALNQVEIELEGIEKMAFALIKPQLDANIKRQENGRYGGMGGRPKKENQNPMGLQNTETQNPMGFENAENKNPNKNDNDNKNDNENLNKNENEEGDGGEIPEQGENPLKNAGNLAPPPSFLSEPQEKYSRIVFEKFKDAGLPCQKGDFFRFQCCDFRLALQKLKGFSSQDVLAAVDNYIFELKNPDSYQLREYSFDNFVGSKTFSNCLPANYRPQNFKKFAKDVPKSPGENDGSEQRHFYDKCLKCGQKLMEWKNPLQKYKCDSCGATFSWKEVDDATEHYTVK
ncbi:MAG: hypothetical protein ILP07_06660 [Treponema sp.]|nr:hypothetical protein [Treponema sp.]